MKSPQKTNTIMLTPGRTSICPICGEWWTTAEEMRLIAKRLTVQATIMDGMRGMEDDK